MCTECLGDKGDEMTHQAVEPRVTRIIFVTPFMCIKLETRSHFALCPCLCLTSNVNIVYLQCYMYLVPDVRSCKN